MYELCIEWLYYNNDEPLNFSHYPVDSLYTDSDSIRILSSRRCWRYLLRRYRLQSTIYHALKPRFEEFYRSKRYNSDMKKLAEFRRQMRDRSKILILSDILPTDIIGNILEYI